MEPRRVRLRSPDADDVVLDVGSGGVTLEAPTGEADVELPAADRLLLLWGRLEAPDDLGSIQALLALP